MFTFIGGVKLLETYSNLLNEIALPAPPHGVRQKVAKDNVPPALKKAIKDLSIAIGNDDIK